MRLFFTQGGREARAAREVADRLRQMYSCGFKIGLYTATAPATGGKELTIDTDLDFSKEQIRAFEEGLERGLKAADLVLEFKGKRG